MMTRRCRMRCGSSSGSRRCNENAVVRRRNTVWGHGFVRLASPSLCAIEIGELMCMWMWPAACAETGKWRVRSRVRTDSERRSLSRGVFMERPISRCPFSRCPFRNTFHFMPMFVPAGHSVWPTGKVQTPAGT